MENKFAYKLLDLAGKKAPQVEVVLSTSRDLEVSFEHNELKYIQEDYTSSLGLRLVADKKIGVASTNYLERWQDLLPLALESAQFGPEAVFDFATPAEFPSVLTYHRPASSLAPQLLAERGREVVEDFKEFRSDVYTNLTFNSGSGASLFCNSSGLELEKEKTYLQYTAFWDLVKDGDMLQIWEDSASCRDDLDLGYLSQKAKKKIQLADEQAQMSSGQYPVVFTPAAFSALLSYITRSLNGKNVVKGVSRLGDKSGKQVFDSQFSVEDDGLLDWKVGSAKFDSEGVPVRKLSLVKGGSVENFYFDLWSASKLGEVSTGHGARGVHSALATPCLHNVLVSGGERSFDDIINSIKVGVLAEQFLGAGQDNPYNGDFSMNLNLGYKIENGKLAGRVKDTMIAGNIFDLLRDCLVELSSEREWVGGRKLLPYVVLDNVAVT